MDKKKVSSEKESGFAAREDLFGYGLSASCTGGHLMEQPDRHQEIEINYLADGKLTYLIGSNEIELPLRSLTLFWGAIPHKVIKTKDVRHFYWIHIPLSWALRWGLSQEFTQRIMMGDIFYESEKEYQEIDYLLVQRWVNDIAHSSVEFSRIALLEIEARLQRFALHHKKGTNKNIPDRLSGTIQSNKALQMARYIGENYLNPLRIEQIAASVSLNQAYAMTLFKNEFGLTITQFINRHRIWHAQRLLATTDEKILTISIDSGFGSLSQFNAVFKEICSMSPKQFKNLIKQKKQ